MLFRIKSIVSHKYFPIVLLLCISLIAHFRWFQSFTAILTYDDWRTHFIDELREFVALPQAWDTTALGQVNINAPFFPTLLATGILAHLHLGYSFSERLLYMLPIVVTAPIGAYLLALHVTKDKFASFFASLVYTFNTYFMLIQTRHLTIATGYAIFPLALYFFIKGLLNKNLANILVSSLICFVMGAYDFRILYIWFFVAILYAFIYLLIHIREGRRTLIKIIGLSSVAVITPIMLNFYWLLGISGASALTSNDIFNRGLFGNDILNLNYALAFMQPFWNGTKPIWFQLQTIPFYFWLLPALAVYGLYYNAAKKQVSITHIYFLILLVGGITLVKQVSAPFGELYNVLYNKVPGFNAFREASKFYVLIFVGTSVLIAIAIATGRKPMCKRLTVQHILVLPVILITIIVVRPYLTGEIGTLFTPRTIPHDYQVLYQYEKKQPGTFKVLWAPRESRWSLNDQSIRNLGFDEAINAYKYQASYNSVYSQNFNDLMLSSRMQGMLSSANVKYIVVPIRDTANDDDFFKYYSFNRDDYTHTLSKLSWLKKVDIGTDSLQVFENTTVKPDFSSTTSMYKFDTTQNVNTYYDFQKQALTNQTALEYITQPKENTKTTATFQKINDLSDNLSASNLKAGQLQISQAINSNKNNTVYADTGQLSYNYQITNNLLKFSSQNANDLYINSNNVGEPIIDASAVTVTLTNNKQYEFAEGTSLFHINSTDQKVRTIGATNEAINLYSSAPGTNLVHNGSFESGLWQNNAQDCNNYDNHPLIGVGRSTALSTDGKYSLLLGANNHTACTSSNVMAVKDQQSYSLEYDYQIKGGQRAGYDLAFNDSKHTVLGADQVRNSGRWYSLRTTFVVPSGATTMQLRLKGYPDDHNKQFADTYYDNVVMQPLNLEAAVVSARSPVFVTSILEGSALHANLTNSKFTYKNVLPNASLENGLWQKKVGDCNAYDSKPEIGMELDRTDKTNGKQSLELNAVRHVACTGPPSTAVQEGKSYLFSFDYKSPTISPAGYYISFNDPNGSVFSEQLPVTDRAWHTFTKSLVVPFGATRMTLSVYSYADQYEGIKVVNLYDNFNLIQIPDIQNRYYVVSIPKEHLQQPSKINFQLISPSKKQVQVFGAKTAFYLNMSESYHPQWRLELDDAQSNSGLASWSPKVHPTAVPDADHFSYDDFLNSWYVDPAALCKNKSSACSQNADGSYNLKLVAEFIPQRYFYVGLAVSGITLFSCVVYLTYSLASKRSSKNRSRSKR